MTYHDRLNDGFAIEATHADDTGFDGITHEDWAAEASATDFDHTTAWAKTAEAH